MCGILSAISFEKPFQDYSIFNSALQTISHRGPDAEGVHTFFDRKKNTDRSQAFSLLMAHKRLSIIDLDKISNQPMASDNVFIVFNGEIFNYIELRQDLLKLGIEFLSNSDTEVILKGYLSEGTSFFSKLNGMWSFVIYDANKNKVIISRDRFGIKPLYYYSNKDVFYIASEIKELKYLIRDLTPNTETIHNFISKGWVDYSNSTFYNEIERFPTKSTWSIDLNDRSISKENYWDFSRSDINLKSENDISEKFRALLLDSLSLRLRADVPFGALLSGGLDSSAIAVLIQSYLKNDIQTFSVISDSEKYSEHSFINLLVEQKNIINHSFSFDVNRAINHVDEVLEIQDEPFGSFSVVAQNMLFSRVKNETDITVLLSGQGADEVLMGYLKYYFYTIIKNFKQLDLVGVAKLVFGALYHSTVFNQFSIAQAKRYFPGNSFTQNYILEKEENSSYPFKDLRERQILDINHFSIPALTRYEDRNSMHHSLEVRLPFLDYRLVDFLIDLPVDFKIKNGWTKYVLRKSVHELPPQIRWRKDKLGFTTPEAEWWRGDLGSRFEKSFEKSQLEELGIISRKKFLSAFQDYRNGKNYLSEGDIFRVYIAEKWLSKNS